MPYNVDKSMGGDNEKNTNFMERCVSGVMDSGKSKSSAIAICKAQMKKKHEAKSEVVFDRIDPEVAAREMVIRWDYIRKLQNQHKISFAQAAATYEAELARYDFNLDRIGK